jgi:replicative DNA helicase
MGKGAEVEWIRGSAMTAKRKPAPTLSGIEGKIPHAPDAERALLGGIMVATDGKATLAQARAIVSEADFFEDRHRRIFRAMVGLAERNVAIDPVTVKEELSRSGELEAVGGPAYIGSLVEGVPQSVNVSHYAGPVMETRIRRDLMERAIELARACTNGHETRDLLDGGAELYRVALTADPEVQRRVRPMREVMADYAASVARGRGRKVWTGLRVLDEAIDGIAPGEVLTVVARPQVGKSALASQVLVNAAIEGEPCVFFSLEMPREQAFERVVMQRLGLTRSRVEFLAADAWHGLTDEARAALNALTMSLLIVDRGKSGIADLDASMLEAAATLGRAPRLVAIDYLGLLSSGAKNLPLYQRVSEAAVDVKAFAKRHQVAVLLASQAGRDADSEKTEGAKSLGLDAARDSGQVEEAADFLVTLCRPELASGLSEVERLEVKGQMFGAVVKNRRGPRPSFRLHFDSNTLRIGPCEDA